ncbi:helix-turn-helix domain-containing protein [Hyphomonas sp. CY54-11-8]|uniref:helix-turn-helix domain-containing protein n=1 Tax=Hyphomonas sp. CY54-11-8 TaxID=1280944 RepID=UPI0005551D1E
MTRPAPLLTVQQAAEYLACSDSTVRRRVDEGKLRSVKLGKLLRFRVEWLEDYIECESTALNAPSSMESEAASGSSRGPRMAAVIAALPAKRMKG